MSKTLYRYTIARRPFYDTAGVLHPVGAFILSTAKMVGDSFVPVDENRNIVGPAVDIDGKEWPHPQAAALAAAGDDVEVTPLSEMTIEQLQQELARREVAAEVARLQPEVLPVADTSKPDGNRDGVTDTFDTLTKAELVARAAANGNPIPDDKSQADYNKVTLLAVVRGEKTWAEVAG